MRYQALYRRFRPKRFDDVIGQDHITTILKNQIRTGHITHAYLFCGSRGTGKTSTARTFAHAVNCLHPVDGEPCGECEACTNEDSGVDILEFDAASNTGVDDMREIIEKASFAPLKLSKKIYIIDEAHMLSTSAFNALLKTLEEPPSHVIFILATTEPQKIPATIISRCQRFDFHRLKISDLVFCMKNALTKSGASIDDEGLIAIARAADGGMRDALSLADQCVAFCGNNVSAQDVYNVLGSMDSRFLFDAADMLISSDAASALKIVDKVVSGGKDLSVFMGDLAGHFRALLLAKICGGNCSDILDCTEDNMKLYQEQANKASKGQLQRAIELLTEAQPKLRWAGMPRILVESTLVKICRIEQENDVSALISRIEMLESKLENLKELESKIANGEINLNAPKAKNTQKVKTTKKEFEDDIPLPDEPPFDVDDNKSNNVPQIPSFDKDSLWNAFIDKMKKTDVSISMLCHKVCGKTLKGNVFTIEYDVKPIFDVVIRPKSKAIMEKVMNEVAPGINLSIVFKEKKDFTEEKLLEMFGDKVKIMD